MPEVTRAPRGAVLTLDASGTVDPQDARSELMFQYFLATTCGGAAIGRLGGGRGVESLPMPPEVIAACPAEMTLTFEVRVEDDGGAKGLSAWTFQFSSVAPVAAIDPPRTLPIGGWPWNGGLTGGTAATITFQAEGSADADGDSPLYFEWSFGPPPEQLALTTSATVSRTVEVSTAGTHFAAVRVRDRAGPDGLWSAPARTLVRVRSEPNLWAIPDDLTIGQIERIEPPEFFPSAEPLFTTEVSIAGQPYVAIAQPVAPPPSPSDNIDAESLGTPAGSGVQAVPGAVDYQIALRPWPDADGTTEVVLDTVTMPSFGGRVSLAAGSDRLWLWVSEYGSSTIRSWQLLPGPAGLAGPATTMTIGPSQLRFAVDSAGNAWMGSPDLSEVRRVAPPDQVSTLDFTGRAIDGVAARPESDEVWVLHRPLDWSVPDPRLERFASSGASLGSIVIPYGRARAMAFAGADELWLSLDDSELVRVDATTLAGPGPFEVAVRSRSPLFAVSAIVGDPPTGGAWAVSLDEYLYRVAYDARTIAAYSTIYGIPQFVDRHGEAWFGAGPYLARGETLAPEGLSVSIPVASERPQWLSTPDDSGGIWTPEFFPPRLVHRAEDGRTVRTVTSVAPAAGGTPRPLPGLFPFRWSPDGTAVGVKQDLAAPEFPQSTPLGLFRYDLSVDPPIEHTLLDAAAASSLDVVGGVLEPSVPPSAPFVWVLRWGPTLEVVRIGADGAELGSWALPASESDTAAPRGGARSIESNRLCLATIEVAATQRIHVRRFDPSGSVEELGVEDLPASYRLSGVAASRENLDAPPGLRGDLCWVAYTDFNGACPEQGRTWVRAWSDPGTLLVDVVAPAGYGEATSLLPLDANRFWMTVERCLSGGNVVIEKHRVDYPFGPTVVLPHTSRVRFVGLETSR